MSISPNTIKSRQFAVQRVLKKYMNFAPETTLRISFGDSSTGIVDTRIKAIIGCPVMSGEFVKCKYALRGSDGVERQFHPGDVVAIRNLEINQLVYINPEHKRLRPILG